MTPNRILTHIIPRRESAIRILANIIMEGTTTVTLLTTKRPEHITVDTQVSGTIWSTSEDQFEKKTAAVDHSAHDHRIYRDPNQYYGSSLAITSSMIYIIFPFILICLIQH